MFPPHRLYDTFDVDLVHGVIEPGTLVNDIFDRGARRGDVLGREGGREGGGREGGLGPRSESQERS